MNTLQNSFRFKTQNVASRFGARGYYLNFKMRVIKCNGSILIKSVSINLDNFLDDTRPYTNSDWTFEGESVEPQIKATIDRYPNNDKDELIQNVKSVAPKSIEGKSLLMTGQTSTLTVSKDGKLGTNAQWVWYENSCGGVVKHRGASYTVSPTNNTTYYVRAESPRDTTACTSIKVEVDDDSKITPNTKVIAPKTICPTDKKITLEVYGGKLGYQAKWVWYKSSCGQSGQKIGTGAKLVDVPIDNTTTFYVRAEGATNTTQCLSHTVVVSELVKKANSISGESSICEGESATLTVNGPKLSDDAKWVWYSDMSLTVRKGEGEVLKVSPNSQTTYYVRAEAFCNQSETISKTIEVKQLSEMPTDITYNKLKGRKYQLNVDGGKLGTGAEWNWSVGDNCNQDNIGKGSSIEYRAKKENTIHVHAVGDCNTTNCFTKTFSHKSSTKPGERGYVFLNVGLISSDSLLDNIVATVGHKKFYFRVKQGIKKNGDNSPITQSYEIQDNRLANFPVNSTNYYEFNGEKYLKRFSCTAGFMMGSRGFRFYVGAGFGSVKPYYGVDVIQYSNGTSKKAWALDVANQYTGFEAEAGVFIKLGIFNMMGGVSSVSGANQKNYIDVHYGLGLTF